MTHEQSPYPQDPERIVDDIRFRLDEFLRGGQDASSLPVLDATMHEVEAEDLVSTIVTDTNDHFWQLAAYTWHEGDTDVPIRLMRRLLYNSDYEGTIVAEFTGDKSEAIVTPAYSQKYVTKQIGKAAVQEKISANVQVADDTGTLADILSTVEGMRFAKDKQVQRAIRSEGRQVRRLLRTQTASEQAGMYGWITH